MPASDLDRAQQRIHALEAAIRQIAPDALPPDEKRGKADEDVHVNSLKNTVHAFGMLWCLQGTMNAPQLARSPMVDSLRGRFAGRPMVIVAPGPSLDKNVHLLQRAKGKALIVAYSRTLGKLQAIGVPPDVVMVLDPLDITFHFAGYPIQEIEALIVGITCNPKLWWSPEFKRRFGYSGNAAIEDWLHRDLTGNDVNLWTSSSVATTTMSLALLVGADPVIWIGQDLGFPGGRMYAEGTGDGNARVNTDKVNLQGQYEIEGLSRCSQQVNDAGMAKLATIDAQQAVWVPSWDGSDKVLATPSFGWVREWMERKADEHNQGRRLINATEGGAHIKGMEHVPFADALDALPDEQLDVPGILDAARDSVDFSDRRRLYLAMCDKRAAEMRRLAILGKKATKILERRPTAWNVARMARIEMEIAEITHRSPVFYCMPAQPVIDKIADELPKADMAKLWEMIGDYVREQRRFLDLVLPRMECAIRHLDNPDMRTGRAKGINLSGWKESAGWTTLTVSS